jgi:NADH dehydrogenase FAD-containing subunit
MIMGYNPKAFISDDKTNMPSIEEKTLYLEQTQEAAQEAHECMRLIMSQCQNKPWTPFKIGDKVWLDNRNLPMPYATRKLNQRREGPFTITQKTSPMTYELKLPDKWCIHNRFHVSLLTPVI